MRLYGWQKRRKRVLILKSFAVQLLPQAKEDIAKIIGYIANNFDDIFAAQKAEKAIFRKIHAIASVPGQGQFVGDEPFFSRGYRKAHAKQYIIYYYADDKKRLVTILAVMHVLQGEKMTVQKLAEL